MTDHRPGARREEGNAAGSSRDTPHVTANDEDAPAQQEDEVPDAPLSPANASGEDKVSTEKLDQGIDDESMYDRRPSENKDWEPGDE